MRCFNKIKLLSVSASALALSTAVGFALMTSTPAMAVETTSGLQGHVISAPNGTKVTVTNVDNGAKATVSVQADGSYSIVGLRPGTYNVTFKSPDGKVLNESVLLTVGETASLTSDMSKATEVVTVIGRRKEVRTSEVATSVSKTQIETMPQNGRNFLSFAALAPGVSYSTDPERKVIQSGPTSANQTNLFIDGMSQKNQVLQGGIAGQDASYGNPFPQDAIQEYKVSTQNFKAEYEQSGSAIITAITITGTNKFKGTAFANYQSKGMVGQPYYERSNPKPDLSNKEYGVTMSGPIIKDKLFWAASAEIRRDDRPADSVRMDVNKFLLNPATETPNASMTSLASALAAKYDGSFAKGFSQDTYWGKLTWLMSDFDTFDLEYKDRKEDDIRGFGGTGARERANTQAQTEKVASLKWRHRGENFFNEASISYQKNNWGQRPTTFGPGITLVKGSLTPPTLPYAPISDLSKVAASFGGIPYAQDKNQQNTTIKDEVTFSNIDWNGRHTVKVGGKIAIYDYEASEAIPVSNPELFYDVRTYVLGGNNTPIAAKIMDGDPLLGASNTQLGAYIQDDWVLDQHWSFNLGIRWDYEFNMMNNKWVTPADVAAAMRAHVGFNKAYNANDFISDGTNRKSPTNLFQPRLGFSYDVHGDSDMVVFGGAGRYYDRNIFDYAQLEMRRQTIHNAQLNFDTTNPWNNAYFTNPQLMVDKAKQLGLKGEIFAINNDVKVPYNDKFSLGIRKKFGKIQTQAIVEHIEAHDLFNWVLGNRQSDGTWGNAWDGTHGDQFQTQPWGDGVPGYGNLLVSRSDRRARSTSLYLTADKPYTKNDGYGWSAKLELNDAESTGHNDVFMFDYANAPAGGWHYAEGVNPWAFYGTFIKDLPWDIRFSGIVNLRRGTPFQQIGNFANGAGGFTLRTIDANLLPREKIGFKQIDFRLSKEFNMPNGNTLIVEGQVYNAFDWVNKKYSGWGGGFTPAGGSPSYVPDQSQEGPARTYMVGLKYKW